MRLKLFEFDQQLWDAAPTSICGCGSCPKAAVVPCAACADDLLGIYRYWSRAGLAEGPVWVVLSVMAGLWANVFICHEKLQFTGMATCHSNCCAGGKHSQLGRELQACPGPRAKATRGWGPHHARYMMYLANSPL